MLVLGRFLASPAGFMPSDLVGYFSFLFAAAFFVFTAFTRWFAISSISRFCHFLAW